MHLSTDSPLRIVEAQGRISRKWLGCGAQPGFRLIPIVHIDRFVRRVGIDVDGGRTTSLREGATEGLRAGKGGVV